MGALVRVAMMQARLRRLGRSLRRVLQTRYPSYLYGPARGVDLCPAFIYHDVTPGEFEGDLRFLRDNGYRTLSTEEFVEWARDPMPTNAVLLTFDDARRSFFDVALPLLEKYRMKATLFVPSRWMSRDDGGETIINPDTRSQIFMDWRQVAACARSNYVDVQSHAYRHALVYTSSRLVAFCTPDLLRRHDVYNWPMRREGGRDVLGPPEIGTPIFESMPLLSSDMRLLEDEDVSAQCVRYVHENGGAQFFSTPGWERQLGSFYERISRQAVWEKMDAPAFQELVDSEFTLADRMFSERLGYTPKYLAYPWMLGSEFSLRLASDHGIAAVFGVGIDYRRCEDAARILPAFGRTKCDWLRFMPGVGRRSLLRAIPQKVMDFFMNQHISH